MTKTTTKKYKIKFEYNGENYEMNEDKILDAFNEFKFDLPNSIAKLEVFKGKKSMLIYLNTSRLIRFINNNLSRELECRNIEDILL